jgi:hypothetical protein
MEKNNLQKKNWLNCKRPIKVLRINLPVKQKISKIKKRKKGRKSQNQNQKKKRGVNLSPKNDYIF